jgi:hypothetical protein
MASKTRCQTPFSLQRPNRRKTLYHSPKTSGRSRQGAPVRTNPVIEPRRTALIRPTDDQACDSRPLFITQNKPIHDTQDCSQKAALNRASVDLRIPRVHNHALFADDYRRIW